MVCIASIATSFAGTVELSAAKQLDTLSKTQNDYLQAIKIETESDVKAELTCESFIRMFRAAGRSDSYNPATLVATKSLKSNEILYRLSEAEYLNAMRKELGLEIKEDELKLTIYDKTIGDKAAQISVLEEYSFTYEEKFTDDYFIKRLYTFNLEKNGSEWAITKVVTNDGIENAETFNYEPIDVTAAVASIAGAKAEAANAPLTTQSREDIVKAMKGEDASRAATARYMWTYNPSRAVYYASLYYNSNHRLFPRNGSSDCQNFASQCVWAGLGADYSSTTANTTSYPAVSTSSVGSSSPQVWSYNQYSNAYSQSYFNWAWDNAAGFPKLIDESGSGTTGPFGTTVYGNLNYADIGDVISVNYDGTAAAGNIDHAMFVTGLASGAAAAGSRSNSDLVIAAHTTDTNSAYTPMLDYAAGRYAESRYATCMIICGYYPIAQPSI